MNEFERLFTARSHAWSPRLPVAKLGSVASIATPGQHQWCSSLEITETEVPVSISIATFCSSISMQGYLHIRDDAYQAMKSTTGHTDHHELPASSLNSQW